MEDSHAPDDLPGPGADRFIERGETYNHEQYGDVEITGIWRGIKKVDDARHTNTEETIIVRYAADGDGKEVDERTALLNEFLDAIEQ